MQSENDSPTTEPPSQPEDLDARIAEKYARIKGLALINDIQTLRSNTSRLDAQARAVRKQQGLEMDDPPDDEIVLGDKHTTYYAPPPGSAAPAPAPQPQPQPAPQPQPPAPSPPAAPEKSFLAKIAPYALTAALAAGGTGLGAYLMSDEKPNGNTDTVIEYTPGFGQPETEPEEE